MLNILAKRRATATATAQVWIRTGTASSSPKRRHLSLHEHQAQGILKEYGIKVPSGTVATTKDEVSRAVSTLGGGGAVLKSQILAGGRGKGTFDNGFKSGVHVVTSRQEAETFSSNMLGYNLITKQTSPEGLPVSRVYVTEKLDIESEYYLAMTVSREQYAPVLLMCKGGGTSIEELAAQSPEQVVNIPLKYSQGITPEIVSIVCQKLGLPGTQSQEEEMNDLLSNLYRVFKESDATLLEINPLVKDRTSGKLVCADTKLTVDNAAKSRQKDIFAMRDYSQERELEVEAERHGLVYIQLEGSIGCVVNGAGLAMATNDAVAHFGGKCANFLDAGGQATSGTMVKAFELLLSEKSVKAILVNIYGGITRCDMIAESIIVAAEKFNDVPVVVRLKGTNSELAQQMIAESGLKLYAEETFDDAVRKAIELAERGTSGAPARINKPVNTATMGKRALRSFSTAPFSSRILRKLQATAGSTKPTSRTFMTSTRHGASYKDTVHNLAINQKTRVMYQGFTGKAATSNAREAIKYGTKIVGGVSRSSKSSLSTPTTHPDAALSSLPIFNTVREAADVVKPDATAVFIPAQFAAGAIIESIEAEIPLIVSVAEHIPVHDMLRVQDVLRTQSKSRLVGPNCPGIISPLHACKIGIMPHEQYSPGCIGIASKSGTLSYEAVGSTTQAELGQSLCVGVGGDLLPGTSLLDAVTAMISDPDTKGIVLLGEIGGDAEIQASDLLKRYRDAELKAGRIPKPVVGMVTGRTAPKGRTMGHAGAISGSSSITAEDKVRAMQDAGIVVPVHPGEIGPLMKRLLQESRIKY